MNFKTYSGTACLFCFTAFTAINSLFLDISAAIGLSIMLVVHEYGHIYVLRKYGIRHSHPIFIPILGALIVTDKIDDEETEIEVAFGGPFIGTIGACIAGGIYILTNHSFWFSTYIFGMMINIVNLLIMVSPLDGGKMLNRIIPGSREFGLLLIILGCFHTKTLIPFAALTTFFYFWFKGTVPEPSSLSRQTRFKWMCIWLGFVLFQIALIVLITMIYMKNTKS